MNFMIFVLLVADRRQNSTAEIERNQVHGSVTTADIHIVDTIAVRGTQVSYPLVSTVGCTTWDVATSNP